MAESKRDDADRLRSREYYKQLIVSQFHSAVAGGTPQAAYIQQLGIPKERVFIPYDVVDNDFFYRATTMIRARPDRFRGLPGLEHGRPFFLASGRFILRKNYRRLVAAYADYRLRVGSGPPWDLVIIGDGPEYSAVAGLAAELCPPGCVHLPGYRQMDDIVAYYAHAGAFVHPATIEQWGLVINEAMAAGLPILASRTVGATYDLVHAGRNGYHFDPFDPSSMTTGLVRMSAPEAPRGEMGQYSLKRIADWSPNRFAGALWNSVESAATIPRRPLSPFVVALLAAKVAAPQRLLAWRSVQP